VLFLGDLFLSKQLATSRTTASGIDQQPQIDDEPSRMCTGRRPKSCYKWKAEKLEKVPESLHFSGSHTSVPVDENRSYPINYFRHFFTDEIIAEIANQSALYSMQTKKTHRWGYKLWVLCGATGFAYDFEVYTGKSDNTLFGGKADCGASGNVVVRMARSVLHHVNYKLFYDNYFTGPDPQVYLSKNGIHSVGTVRSN